MTTVRALYDQHTGYVSDKWSSYLDVYERLFAPFQQRPISLLEIGIQNGGSLEIWDRYFANAVRIVGCDIDPRIAQLRFGPKVSLVAGDIAAPDTVAKLQQQSPTYDIIIDDGSHRSDHIITAFETLFPIVEAGGLFVAEDLHCSYWRRYKGGLLTSSSSIEYFKRLIDVINADHWRNSRKGRFTSLLHPILAPKTTGMTRLKPLIRSIQFYDSICVIERAKDEAGLGPRVIAGREALVDPGSLKRRREPAE